MDIRDLANDLSLDNPLFADFERMPATFDEFITNPYYLGKSWKNPFPTWKEAGEKMFPLPMRSPYNSVVLLGATGIGKALEDNQKVLVKEMLGVKAKKISKVKVGDFVASIDGRYYPISGVFPQGKKPIYKVTFGKDGAKTIKASGDHIWTVSRDRGITYHDETTEEILQSGLIKNNRYTVQVMEPEELPWASKSIQDKIDRLSDYRTRVITGIKKTKDASCTCIMTTAPNKLFLTKDGIPTHNTSFAVNMVMAYYLHVILCLRNPHEYFALEEQKNIVFAFINIVTKSIAYQNAWGMFHKALLQSPFFMEYGIKTNQRQPEWKCTKKPVSLIYGAAAEDIIGLDIICCLTGESEIKTSEGFKKIQDLVGKQIQVPTYNPVTKQQELSRSCTVIHTKDTTELIEIELENGNKIRCTPEHKLLLKSGIYKRADELTDQDELEDGR